MNVSVNEYECECKLYLKFIHQCTTLIQGVASLCEKIVKGKLGTEAKGLKM